MTLPHPVPSSDLTRPFQVVDDVQTRVAALVVLRAVGEDGQALGSVSAGCDRDGTRVRVYEGGYVVLVGMPAHVFPGLANGPDAVTIHLTAPGREVLHVPVAIPQNAVLPVRPGDMPIPGRPVTFAGQVRRLNAAAPPIPGALVSCLADVGVPGLHPLALRVPLRADQAAAVPVTPATVTEAGPVLTVTAPAAAGADTVALTARTGLGSGIAIRLGDLHRAQLAEVAELIPPGAGAGVVKLAQPLLGSVPEGSPVRRATVAAAGAPVNLLRDARAGDGVLCLVADLAPDFAILGGDTYPCGAVTGADGYYRLSGVRGLAAVAVRATATGLAGTQPVTIVAPNYRQPTNTVDLGVKP